MYTTGGESAWKSGGYDNLLFFIWLGYIDAALSHGTAKVEVESVRKFRQTWQCL
jgi:hypothetical protein